MKKNFILLFFVVNVAFGQSLTLLPGNTGFIAIPTVASLPTVTAADKGKIVFLTTNNKFYFCDGGASWKESLTKNSMGLYSIDDDSFSNTIFNVENTNTLTPGGSTVAIKGTANSLIGIGILGSSNSGTAVSGNSTNGTAGSFISTNNLALATNGKLRFGGNGVGTIALGKVLKAINSNGDTQWSDVLSFPYSFSGSSPVFPFVASLFEITNTATLSGSTSITGTVTGGAAGLKGIYGRATNSSPTSNNFGVFASNESTNGFGVGLWAEHFGTGTAGVLSCNNGTALQTYGKLRFGGSGVGTIAAGKVLKAKSANGDAEWDDVLGFPYSFSGNSPVFPFVASLFEITNTATLSGSTSIAGTVTGGAAGLKGIYGRATNSSPTSNNFGVFASNESTNGFGVGLWAEHFGTGTAGVLSCNNGTALQTFGGLRFGGNGVGTISAGKVLKAINSNGDAQWSDLLSFPYAASGGGTFPVATFQITNTNTASGSTAIKGIGRVGVHGEATEVTPTIPNWGIRAYNLATNSLGYGIEATHNGGGIGGWFSSNSGTAGYFTSTSGNAIITGTGNVGIGNSTPNAPLQFSNALNNRKLVIYEAANNAHQFYGIGLNSGVFRYQVDGTSSNHIFYAAASASASNELMRITGLGRVGIGVASPDQILDVNGRARIRHSGSTAGVWMSNSTNSTNGADGAFYGMKTDTEAGIWIGNNWRFWVNNSGNATFTGTVTASCGVLACSDFRFKTNIKPIENSLASIMKINGVRYDWKKEEFPERNFNDKNQLGFIAQEIEKVFPEMVFTDEKGYKSVDYGRLTPVLVEAIKELKMMNDELKNKNQKIEGRLERIEAALNH